MCAPGSLLHLLPFSFFLSGFGSSPPSSCTSSSKKHPGRGSCSAPRPLLPQKKGQVWQTACLCKFLLEEWFSAAAWAPVLALAHPEFKLQRRRIILKGSLLCKCFFCSFFFPKCVSQACKIDVVHKKIYLFLFLITPILTDCVLKCTVVEITRLWCHKGHWHLHSGLWPHPQPGVGSALVSVSFQICGSSDKVSLLAGSYSAPGWKQRAKCAAFGKPSDSLG